MTNTTDLAALWREREEACAKVEEACLEPDDDPNWTRYLAADAAIRAARPMTLAGIAIQARVLEDSLSTGYLDADEDLARVIAEQLGVLAEQLEALA